MITGDPWGICGHRAAVSQLRNVIEYGRVPHAVLLTGKASVGKTTLATAFAKALICRQRDLGMFCGECSACKRIERSTHPDVETYSRESQRHLDLKEKGQHLMLSIETVRKISERSALRPLEADWRVVIVDDVETMQGVAQEAFLKTLEEPPPFLVMLLLAEDSSLILPTVESRCLRIDLQPVSTQMIEALLLGMVTSGHALSNTARLSAGAPGWAVRAMQDPSVGTSRMEMVDEGMEWLWSTDYHRLVKAYRIGEEFLKRRDEVLDRVSIISGILRDALRSNNNEQSTETFVPDHLHLREKAADWTPAQVLLALQATEQCIDDLLANVRPRLALEVMVMNWPSTVQASS